MEGHATIGRAPGVVGADVADLHVLLNDDLRYVGLDEVGSYIWELLATPCSYGDLVDRLCAEFAIEPERCRADIAPFLAELISLRLVTTA